MPAAVDLLTCACSKFEEPSRQSYQEELGADYVAIAKAKAWGQDYIAAAKQVLISGPASRMPATELPVSA
jgi:hypothetical protein